MDINKIIEKEILALKEKYPELEGHLFFFCPKDMTIGEIVESIRK